MDPRQSAEDEMRAALDGVGFDYGRPDPQVAWWAFLDFIGRPLPGLTTATIGVTCYNADDRDDVLWLEYVRELEGPGEVGQLCGCVLTRTVPAELRGVSRNHWWWAEHGTIAEWGAYAQEMPEFAACLELVGWKWEGFWA